MWVLTNIKSSAIFYVIREKCKFTIGRVGADLVLRDDNSISRTHAFLHLVESVNGKFDLEIEDAGSKYGTFMNDGIESNSCVEKGEHIALNVGDRIRFGLLMNIWHVSRHTFVSISSALPRDEMEQYMQNLHMLGGTVLANWQSICTHLTMNEISLTIKVLHALLDQVPIVTCDYWRNVLKSARNRESLPSTDSYVPRIGEALLQITVTDLNSNSARKRVFHNMTFVFMNRKYYEMYEPIVEKAGGTSKELNFGVPKSLLLKKNVVVVQYVPTTQSQSSQIINNIMEYLESHSLRLIPEYEIGLAILHCSTEKYCNPSYKVLNDIIPSTLENMDSLTDAALMENTSISTKKNDSESSELVIPETDGDNAISCKYDVLNCASTSLQTSSDVEVNALLNTEEVDEITHVHNKNKRKRVEQIVDNSDEENLDGALHSTKKPHIAIESIEQQKTVLPKSKKTPKPKTNTTPKSRINPLPITIHSKKESISTAGFLEKSQVVRSQNEPNRQQTSSSGNVSLSSCETGGRKRPRIAIIGDDDDDDDLFNFGNGEPNHPQELKKSRLFNSNADDDDLFAFEHAAKENVDIVPIDVDDENLEPTEPFLPKKNAESVAMPRPKELPRKVSIHGWLSCTNVKVDPDKEEIIKEEDNSVDSKEWVDSWKGGFMVRLRALNISTRACHNQAEASDQSKPAEMSHNSKKNFKTFVKKHKVNQQRLIINTTPIVVGKMRTR